MNVVFMTGGAREQALEYLLDNKVSVSAVICPKPSKRNSRFSKVILIAHQYGVPVFCVDRDEVTSTLENLDYDILLSCGFSYVIDKQAINTAKKIAINVHPTLLPKYRGYRSGPFILINGEEESGVTIHELVHEMDRGDILLQKSFPITQFDTTKSVFRKATSLEPGLILEVIKRIESDTIIRVPQDELKATEFNQIRTPKDSLVDVNKSLKELYNFIRSCDFDDYPAHFYQDGEKVLIKLVREKKLTNEEDLI